VLNLINTEVPLLGYEGGKEEQKQQLHDVIQKVDELKSRLKALDAVDRTSIYRDIGHLKQTAEDSDEEEADDSIASRLKKRQRTYESLKTKVWSPILNSVQTTINIQSGIVVSSKKDGGGAKEDEDNKFLKSSGAGGSILNLSVLEQVAGVLSHEKSRNSSTSSSYNGVSAEVLTHFIQSSINTGADEQVITDDMLRTASTRYFDDSKVYREMLKDYVSSQSTSTGSTSESASAVIRSALSPKQASKSSLSGAKANVDRRASKARKIRFAVMPKLVNFNFPKALAPESASSMGEDMWFKSMFGGVRGNKIV
jgi:hypothetical protein